MNIARKIFHRHAAIFFLVIFFGSFFLSAHAKNKFPAKKISNKNFSSALPWSLELGLGYTHYQNLYKADGNTALTRLGIAKEFFSNPSMHAGIEFGIQNGNTARLDISQSQLNILGGVPIDFVIKPILDAVLTGKIYPVENSFFTVFKAGVILRRMQFTRDTLNDLAKIDPEILLGIGFDINRLASIYFAYQGILGKDPHFQIINPADVSPSAKVSGIPTEHSALIGLSLRLDSFR